MHRLSKRSQYILEGINPQLSSVVQRAIEISSTDFGAYEGLRTRKQQREYVAKRVSRIMESKHLPQKDGLAKAVDLVPYINRKFRWELEPCYELARAMRQAARELGVPVVWGGCWKRLDSSTTDPEIMVEQYITQRRRQAKRPFVDAFHFELP